MSTKYPIKLEVDYPKQTLNRLTTFFRIFVAIPILIVLCSISATTAQGNDTYNSGIIFVGGGLLFIAPLLMILFRQKYPRWWFDWNLELVRFSHRVCIYLMLLTDRYPSTDDQQSVHLDITYPNVQKDLNRWLPLVKWFLAIPHYFIIFFLDIAAIFVTIIAWFAILFTGNYPKSMFDFVVGVIRWNLRVTGYAFLLVTDTYPPFSLGN